MESDQVVEALRRYVLAPDAVIEDRRDWPGIVVFYAGRFRYEARAAPWRIAAQPWVEAAVRVVADGQAKGFVIEYGLLFEVGDRVLNLNDVATMRELGRRLDDDLDPLAYAEVLAELYSGPRIDAATVLPFAATELHRAGSLIGDVDEFAREYPFVDATGIAAPTVRRQADQVAIDFYSCHYYLTESSGAVDILQWTVVGGAGRDVSWSRRYVAQRVERTY